MRHQRKESQSLAGLGTHSKSNQTENEYSMLATAPGATSLEVWIKRLGVEVEISMKHGHRSRAHRFMQVMYAAIRARSQSQQNRRFMEIDAAIWGHQS